MNSGRLFLVFAVSLAVRAAWAQAPGGGAVPPKQTPGFLEIPWGSSEEFARKQFPTLSRSHLDRIGSSEEQLQFVGGKFAGLKVTRFYLHFSSDRLWKADVVFEAVTKDHKREFVTVRQMLVEKYGPPTSDDKHDQDQGAEWYLDGPAGVDKDKIYLSTESHGSGMKLFYAADRIARTPAGAPKAADASGNVKALPVTPGAKDDL